MWFGMETLNNGFSLSWTNLKTLRVGYTSRYTSNNGICEARDIF